MNTTAIRNKAKAQIDSIFNQIEKLEKKKDFVSQSLANEYRQRIAFFKEARKGIRDQYNSLSEVTEDKLDEAKSKLDYAITGIEKSISELKNMF